MAHHVFILGAGASAPGGCPTMGNFIEVARRIAVVTKDKTIRGDYDIIEEFRRIVARGAGNTRVDAANLEHLFVYCEMAETLGLLLDTRLDLTAVRHSLCRLVANTISRSQTCQLAWENPRRAAGPVISAASGPAGYMELAYAAGLLLGAEEGHSVDFITFNYDVGLEIALITAGISISYGMGDPYGDCAKSVRVFKLHGSLNWRRVRVPAVMYRRPDAVRFLDPREAIPMAARENRLQTTTLDTQGALYRDSMQTAPEESDPEYLLPLIIPPSEKSNQQRKQIQAVWAGAHRSLMSANSIVVVGYSLPESDIFFRQFLALSLIDAMVRRFWVIDQHSGIIAKFKDLVGPSIRDERFRGIDSGMLNGLGDLREQIEEDPDLF